MHGRRFYGALAAGCFIWLGIRASCAAPNETAVRAQVKTEAVQLLQSGDLAGFDARATELRRSRERTPAGIWKLSLFYKGVDDLPANPAAPIWSTIERATNDYLQAHPDSASAVALSAHVLVSRAWRYRGDGWGSQLSSEQQDGFATWLERARVILDEYREVGRADPEWFSLRIQIMNGQGEDRSAILALAKEALGSEPTYQPTYYVASTAFLPKWGGNAQLLQQYLDALLASAHLEEGRQPYARIAFNIARNDPKPIRTLEEAGMRWPEVKQGLEEITAAYPDDWNRNAERAMACLIGTEQDFNSSSSRTGPRPIAVAWFDTAPRWRDCKQRQQAATPASFAAIVQGMVFASPSPYLPTTICCAVLLALATLYGSRRLRSGGAAGSNAGEPPGMVLSGDPYKRIYRATWEWKCLQVAAGGVLLLAGAAGVWGFGAVADATLRDNPVGLGLVFFSALLASVGVMVIVDANVSRLELQGSVLEIFELWRVQRIRREDIASRQTLRPRNSPAQLILRFKESGRRPSKISLVFSMDTRFDDWMRPIPDVDAMAAADLEAQIRSAPELGATPEERVARFAQASKIARCTALLGPVLFFWSALYPHPYLLILGILASLPWVCVGLMIKYPNIYRLDGTAGSRRPDLTSAFLAGGVLLAARAYFDVHVLDWPTLAPWAIAAGMLLAASAGWANRQGPRTFGSFMVILLAASAYGYGAATYANATFDRSAAATYHPSVLRKHSSGGRHRTYELLVGPWGPRTSAEDISVSAALYSRLSVGQPACVSVRNGALGSHWYSVSVCNDSASL